MIELPYKNPAESECLIADAQRRILILDGAMGSMLQRYKLGEDDFRGDRFRHFGHDLKGNNDLLVLTQPKIVQAVHQAYLDAGADLIETNSFNATRVSQADYHLEEATYDLNVAAAKLVRRHPHVFGDQQAASAELAFGRWEAQKQQEKAAAAAARGDDAHDSFDRIGWSPRLTPRRPGMVPYPRRAPGARVVLVLPDLGQIV